MSFACKKTKQPTVYTLFLFYFPYTVSSKNMGGIPWNVTAWRSVLQTSKFGNRRLTDSRHSTQYAQVDVGTKEVAVYCSVDLLLCVGHIRTVLQDPVMSTCSTCLVLTTCLRCVKMGWHQRPKIHRAVA